MRIIVTGTRDFYGLNKHRAWLKGKFWDLGASEVLCGTNIGAEAFGREVAKECGLRVVDCPIEWCKFGRSAVYVKDEKMAQNADTMILFGDGPERMRKLARSYDLELVEYEDVL